MKFLNKKNLSIFFLYSASIIFAIYFSLKANFKDKKVLNDGQLTNLLTNNNINHEKSNLVEIKHENNSSLKQQLKESSSRNETFSMRLKEVHKNSPTKKIKEDISVLDPNAGNINTFLSDELLAAYLIEDDLSSEEAHTSLDQNSKMPVLRL